MTRSNKKIEEMRRVEQLRQGLGGNPPGLLESADGPDVLVVTSGHRTGIEVTEIHQQSSPEQGPRRIQESERWGIALSARQLAESSGIPIVDVSVLFNDSVRIQKADREAITSALVDLVRKNIPSMDTSVELAMWRENNPCLRSVLNVRIFRNEFLTRHYWSVLDSGWVQTDFVQEMQGAIDKKNALFEGYSQQCDECWLLVFAHGGRPSGSFQASQPTKAHLYRSAFARTFFLEAFSGRVVELNTTAP